MNYLEELEELSKAKGDGAAGDYMAALIDVVERLKVESANAWSVGFEAGKAVGRKIQVAAPAPPVPSDDQWWSTLLRLARDVGDGYALHRGCPCSGCQLRDHVWGPRG